LGNVSAITSWVFPVDRVATVTFRIRLNARVIANNCSNVSNCISSVFSHEFGHVFYQADNPPVGANYSIMREDRNRNASNMRGPK